MGRRLKFIVAYDGTPFSGWQSQLNGNGIQDRLEAAFEQISSEKIRVHGAGRTDAGVHALAQCAHVDLPEHRYEASRWVAALNGVLPPTIRIMRASFASPSFHARFAAKAKIYRYRIWNGEVLPPLEHGRAWHIRDDLDLKAMAIAAKLFVGRHDFKSFAANRGSPVDDTFRTLHRVQLRRTGRVIAIEFEGDGFLYKMVRLMVGTLARIGLRDALPAEIRDRLEAPRRVVAAGRNAAPASGLFLIRIRY